jgi:hypothetical protein
MNKYGISFYITDIPLGIDAAVESSLGSVDGVLFCPMSNVRCVNTFGHLVPKKQENGDA